NLPQGGWKIVGDSLLIKVPSGKSGSAELQIYNGQAPLLPVQKFTYKENTSAAPAPEATPAPTATPTPTPTVSKSPETKPAAAPSFYKIYFEMNSSKISVDEISELQELCAPLLGGKFVVTVTGFVQPTKVNPNEVALSIARARSVVREMKRIGIDATYLVKSGGSAPRNAPSSRYALIEFAIK
ncbi:MAG: hypothetical protein ACKOXI_01235, partial [Candidatus Planktophila sp.]